MNKNIGKSIYALLAVGIIILALVGVISNFFFQKASLEHHVEYNILNYQKQFNSHIDREALMIKSFLKLISEQQNIQSSFINSNKTQLFNNTQYVYNSLNKNNDITHFYFIKPEGKVFLRVHDFKRDSDTIKRYTFLKAKETNDIFYGIEFGIKKNYTLRVVYPWIVDGKLIGYLEIGKEIDKIINIVNQQLGIEIFLSVNKNEYKNSPEFIQNKLQNFMQTGDDYIVYQSLPNNKKIVKLFETKEQNSWLTIQNKTYIGYIDTLEDISQKKLGNRLFLVDISQDYQGLKKSLIFYTSVMMVGTFFMLLLGYFFAIKKQEKLDKALFKIKSTMKEKSNLLSLFEHGDSVLFKWNNDEKWSVDYVSSNVENLLGYTKDAFLDSEVSYTNCIHNEDISQVIEEVEKGKKSKNKFFKHKPYRIVTKSGKIKWVLDYTLVVKDNNQNITHFLGYIINITEQETVLKNLEKFIDTQDNMVMLTNGKQLEFANKQFFNFIGYKNLENFKKKHDCICEFFIDNDRFFHLGKINDDQNWVEIMQTLPHSERIVAILSQDLVIHAFSVTINEFENNLLIVSFTDISQTMLNQIELENKTIHDKLTGAYNREYFEQNYQRLIDEYTQSNHQFALALLDIDHFKKVNDIYGHDVGDYVLQHFVATIQKFSRDEDILVRWGGEEFIIILKINSTEDLQKALEHIRKVIELEKFKTIGHKTCSLGATMYIKGENIDKTIKRADEAVYEAKANGRNQVVIKL